MDETDDAAYVVYPQYAMTSVDYYKKSTGEIRASTGCKIFFTDLSYFVVPAIMPVGDRTRTGSWAMALLKRLYQVSVCYSTVGVGTVTVGCYLCRSPRSCKSSTMCRGASCLERCALSWDLRAAARGASRPNRYFMSGKICYTCVVAHCWTY